MSFAWLVWALLNPHVTALTNESVSGDLLHTNFTPYNVTTTNVPLASIITTVLNPMNTPLGAGDPPITIDDVYTDSVDTSRAVTAASTDPPNGGLARPEQDASSKIQAIFFGVAATCIGIATLIVTVLAFRRMPKRKQPNPESPLLERDDHSPCQHAELLVIQSQREPIELDAMQTAVELQCDEPGIRDMDAQAAIQTPNTMAVTA